MKKPEDENTLELYQRKKRERRKRKKGEARKKGERGEIDGDSMPSKTTAKSNFDDEFFGVENDADDGPEEADDFVVDVKDDRFAALHEDHQFAIDPTHPQCVVSTPAFAMSCVYVVCLADSKRPKAWQRFSTNARNAKKVALAPTVLCSLKAIRSKVVVVGRA